MVTVGTTHFAQPPLLGQLLVHVQVHFPREHEGFALAIPTVQETTFVKDPPDRLWHSLGNVRHLHRQQITLVPTTQTAPLPETAASATLCLVQPSVLSLAPGMVP